MKTKLIRCTRCNRRMRGDGTGWNVTVDAGVIVGHLCPNCQTPEETAEAEINEATLDYARDAFGRLMGAPKVDVEEAKTDYIVDMIRHCEQVLRDWLREVVDSGQTRPLDFDALVTRAIETLPPDRRPSAAINRGPLREIFEGIISEDIYDD